MPDAGGDEVRDNSDNDFFDDFFEKLDKKTLQV